MVVVVRARWRPMLRRASLVLDFNVRGSSTITRPINETTNKSPPKAGSGRKSKAEMTNPPMTRARYPGLKRSGTGNILIRNTTRPKNRLKMPRKMKVP